MELLQLVIIELHRHLANFLHAHAMLTGDAATHLHTEFQDLAAERLGALKFAWHVGIKQDQRVQVAIARMKHVRHPQAELF